MHVKTKIYHGLIVDPCMNISVLLIYRSLISIFNIISLQAAIHYYGIQYIYILKLIKESHIPVT